MLKMHVKRILNTLALSDTYNSCGWLNIYLNDLSLLYSQSWTKVIPALYMCTYYVTSIFRLQLYNGWHEGIYNIHGKTAFPF